MLDNVLCVEDDAISQMLLKQVISKSSFANQIQITSNGHEALEYYEGLLKSNFNNNYPRLIFLDLNMPIINGWEFLDEFTGTYLHHFQETKVAILTSSIDNEDKKRALKYSIVTEYLTKPLTIDSIGNLKTKISQV